MAISSKKHPSGYQVKSCMFFGALGGGGVLIMVFNATFNISVLPWQSVLLVEETGVPVENYQPAASH